MRPLLEFCVNNGAESVIDHFEQDHEYDVIEYGCLGNCGECACLSFAYIDGMPVTAENPQALIEEIKNQS